MKRIKKSRLQCLWGIIIIMTMLSGCNKVQQSTETSKSTIPNGEYVCNESAEYSIQVKNDVVEMTKANYEGTFQLYYVAEYSLISEQLQDEGIRITPEKKKEIADEITQSFDTSQYVGKTYSMSFEESEMDGKRVIWIYLMEDDMPVTGLSGSYWPEDGTLWIAGASYHKK